MKFQLKTLFITFIIFYFAFPQNGQTIPATDAKIPQTKTPDLIPEGELRSSQMSSTEKSSSKTVISSTTETVAEPIKNTVAVSDGEPSEVVSKESTTIVQESSKVSQSFQSSSVTVTSGEVSSQMISLDMDQGNPLVLDQGKNSLDLDQENSCIKETLSTSQKSSSSVVESVRVQKSSVVSSQVVNASQILESSDLQGLATELQKSPENFEIEKESSKTEEIESSLAVVESSQVKSSKKSSVVESSRVESSLSTMESLRNVKISRLAFYIPQPQPSYSRPIPTTGHYNIWGNFEQNPWQFLTFKIFR